MISVGVFVGGRSRRMGFAPKGLLVAPDGATILERTLRLARALTRDVVLVGRRDAYDVDAPSLPDPDGDAGPLGGLLALLDHAGAGQAIALACDMPFLRGEVLARLASHAASARAVAPRRAGRWEPLFARYDARGVLDDVRARLARRELSLQGLLDAVGAEALPLAPDELATLDDWDRPEDLP